MRLLECIPHASERFLALRSPAAFLKTVHQLKVYVSSCACTSPAVRVRVQLCVYVSTCAWTCPAVEVQLVYLEYLGYKLTEEKYRPKMNCKRLLVLRHSTALLCPATMLHGTQVRENYTHIQHSTASRFKFKHRVLPHPKEKVPLPPKTEVPEEFRFIYPEFLPTPRLEIRNRLREKIERIDMVNRRKVLDIPEFYVGSIMAVTVSDVNATGKSNRFVGICIERGGLGTQAWFTLRNVIDQQGLEIRYDMYCPLITAIETLRLEKRLDDTLVYLRDALPEYSTVPLDFESEILPEGTPVPVNETKVKMLRSWWHAKWRAREMKGVDYSDITDDEWHEIKKRFTPDWDKFDLMKEYRASLPLEEHEVVFRDIAPHYPQLRAGQRRSRRRLPVSEA
ncbi:Ribosomal protein L19 [Trinorchestia longiramus]|nr:Ribosomal protein L19 [Trinorchestia longiramus]